MPDTAASPFLPTVTVTVLSSANVVMPSKPAETVIVVAPSPSPTFVGLTLSVAVVGTASSSVIVPFPEEGEPSVALVGDARVTMKVSSPSARRSSLVCTSMVAVVDPAAMVAVRAVATAA